MKKLFSDAKLKWVIAFAWTISAPALATTLPLTQTIITLINNGSASEVILPLNSEINIQAAQIDQSEIYATGQIAIEVIT
jgi:hypothetical protein